MDFRLIKVKVYFTKVKIDKHSKYYIRSLIFRYDLEILWAYSLNTGDGYVQISGLCYERNTSYTSK